MIKENFEKAKHLQRKIDDLERKLEEIDKIEKLGAIKIVSVHDYHRFVYVDGMAVLILMKNLRDYLKTNLESHERQFDKL